MALCVTAFSVSRYIGFFTEIVACAILQNFSVTSSLEAKCVELHYYEFLEWLLAPVRFTWRTVIKVDQVLLREPKIQICTYLQKKLNKIPRIERYGINRICTSTVILSNFIVPLQKFGTSILVL